MTGAGACITAAVGLTVFSVWCGAPGLENIVGPGVRACIVWVV